jgi:hypothetical protein
MVTADERITDGRNRSIASQGHRFVKMERVFVAIITRERRDPDNPFGPLRSRLLPAASSQPAAGLSWALVARADERPKPPAGAVMMNHRRWFGPEAGGRKPPDVLSPALDAASSRRLCARIVPRSGDLILRISRPVQCKAGPTEDLGGRVFRGSGCSPCMRSFLRCSAIRYNSKFPWADAADCTSVEK